MAKFISITKRMAALEALSKRDGESCAADFVAAGSEDAMREAFLEAHAKLAMDSRQSRWSRLRRQKLKADDPRRVGDPLYWPFSVLTVTERDVVRQAIMRAIAR